MTFSINPLFCEQDPLLCIYGVLFESTHIINKQQTSTKMSFYCYLHGIILNTIASFQPTSPLAFLPYNLLKTSPTNQFVSSPAKIQSGPLGNSERAQQNIPSITQTDCGTSRNKKLQKKSRRRFPLKQLQSARKNSESNLVNQMLGFLSSPQKSDMLVSRAISQLAKTQDQKERIKTMFYNVVRCINLRRGRKYSNSVTVKNYYTPARLIRAFPNLQRELQQIELLSLEELCRLFRICTHAFIRTASVSAVLTSKRISGIAKPDHLKRIRKVSVSLQSLSQ